MAGSAVATMAVAAEAAAADESSAEAADAAAAKSLADEANALSDAPALDPIYDEDFAAESAD